MQNQETKKLVLNVVGNLDSTLSKDILKQIQNLSNQKAIILLDFSGLASIEISSSENMPAILRLATLPNLVLGVTGIDPSFRSQIEIFIADNPVEMFSSKEKGKKDLDSQEESLSNPQQSFIVRCPACNVKLRVRSHGNHQCPACKSKFTVLSNGKVSSFQKVSFN
ncbi:MAG: hypothetical protein AAF518_01910 [Spirochaetota bacterium]